MNDASRFRPRSTLGFLVLGAWLGLGGTSGSQVDWRNITPGPGGGECRMAYDSTRGVVVVLGTTQFRTSVWAWDGQEWTCTLPGTNAPSAQGAAMVYDSLRDRMVVLTESAATWEWNGNVWTQRFPATSPRKPADFAMAFDSLRGRTVLFGGGNDETWEWDGVDWALRTPSGIRPPWLKYHAMAFDSRRGRTVLFGGHEPNRVSSDTWEWDGTSWHKAAPATNPPPLIEHAMAYDSDRGVVVLSGGTGYQDTWEWDGVEWTKRLPVNSPPALKGTRLAFDARRRRTVSFAPTYLFEWDGADWNRPVSPVIPNSFATSTPDRLALASDTYRGRVVLFGGWSPTGSRPAISTLEWDGREWTLPPAGIYPPGNLMDPAMGFDPAGNRTLLFGGTLIGGTSLLSGTWEWDGTCWSTHAPAVAPANRWGAALAFDSNRGTVLLFGGRDRTTVFGDTWEWDGIAKSWTRLQPALSPPARSMHAMAPDPSSGRILLFGGTNGTATLSDTWEWSGKDGTWTNLQPPASPSCSASPSMAADPVRRKVFLCDGGRHWAWDGQTWLPIAASWISQYHSLYGAFGLAFDTRRGRMLAFQGEYLSPLEVWEYGSLNWSRTAPGCPGPGGWTPALSGHGGELGGRAHFHIGEAPPQASAFLLAGARPLSFPFSCGLVAVDPLSILLLPVGGLRPGSGQADLALPVPAASTLAGQELLFQAVLVDPGTTCLSNAARLRLVP